MSEAAEAYNRIHAILDDARKLCGPELDRYLDESCGPDEGLRASVLELLAAGSDEGASDLFAQGHAGSLHRELAGLQEEALASWLPERIGAYTILRQLGQGGMGVVYEAEQASPRRRVAIKLLHPMQVTPDRMRRFRREAALLGRLQHPGIAQIHEAGTYEAGRGPQPFFAMELVEGVDLRTHCDREGLDRRARVELLVRVADAVQYAHEHGIIHRDLKPDNVLVDGRGRPRILDFGIAKASSHSATLSTLVTEEGQLVGTLAYMAPEQLDQTADEVTPLVDVFALGVLAFEILVGRLPREIGDLSLSRAITLLATSEAPRAGTFDGSLRGDLETILGKALESEPARRYQSAAALAGDLRRHLAHRPIHARPPSRIYLVKKFSRRHRGLVVGALATLLVLVAGTVVSTVFAVQAREQRNAARQNETRAINGTLQSARVLIDAGRGRDAVTQLRLVPEEARGLAWRLLRRSAPAVLDVAPGRWLFLDDEHLVGHGEDAVVVHSLLERRTIRRLFRGQGLVPFRAGRGGFVVARRGDEVLILDVWNEAILARAAEVHVDGRILRPAGQDDAGGWLETRVSRLPEISDDGRTILGYADGRTAEVRLDGERIHVVRDLGIEEAVHLGPDGRDLVVNRRDHVSVVDLASGAVRLRHAFGPDRMASGLPVEGGVLLRSAPAYPDQWSLRRVVRRFELSGGTPSTLLEPDEPFASGFEVVARGTRRALAYPRDGRFVAATRKGGDSQGVHLGSARSGQPLGHAPLERGPDGRAGFLLFPEKPGSDVDVAPSGRRLVVSNGWAQPVVVELWPRGSEAGEDTHVLTLCGHTDALGRPGSGWIYHLAVSNDGSLVASAAPLDPRIRLFDARTGECVATLERDALGPASYDALMAFSPDDERLVVTTPHGGEPTRVLDWHITTGEVRRASAALADRSRHHLLLLDRFLEVLDPGPRARLSQRVQMLGRRAVAGFHPHAPGLPEADRPSAGERWRYVPGAVDAPPGMSVHPSLARVAVVEQVGGAKGVGRLTVVDARTGQALVERELLHQPWCVAYSPDGKTLAVGTQEASVLLFETTGCTQQLEWRAHEGLIHSIAWTPDGTRLVTASGDETVRIHDTRTRAASRLADERWRALRAEMATRDDVEEAFEGLRGEEREAARIERIRRAHAR